MQTDISEAIFEKVKRLPKGDQEDVLHIVEEKMTAHRAKDTRPIWERIIEMSAEIPDEEWAKLPSDGSANHDHYLYGSPKKY